MSRDSQNPYTPITANDKADELVGLVIDWYRGNRFSMTAAQQSAAITAITGVLNGTLRV
jgi:hypothetical protein